MPARTILPEPLTRAAWTPFGELPVDDTDPGDAADLEFVWGDGHANYIGHHRDEVVWTGVGVLCDHLNKHETHTQLLMPVNCDAVVVVAPASVDFSEPGDLDEVKAFVVRPYEPFMLFRSTWHWGPFPVSEDLVRLFNVQGRRFAEDNIVARFEPVEVRLKPG
jgi:ureidoglycolate hydrolase